MDQAHVPDPGQRHVQSSRNGGSCQSQYIDGRSELLEAFLVNHSKPLFLIDDHQSEIFEFDVLGEQPVGTHHDIRGTRADRIDGALLLLRGPESRERIDADRKGSEAFHERLVVLCRENRGGTKHRDLSSL